MKKQTIIVMSVVIVIVGAAAVHYTIKNKQKSTNETAIHTSAESMEKNETDAMVENGHTLTPEEAKMMERDKMATEKNESAIKKESGDSTMTQEKHGIYMHQILLNGTATEDAGIADNKAAVEAFVTHSSFAKHVLFFHATWCPECKAAHTAFLQKEAEIPAGVMVIKIDYDSHPQLKKLYGVTYQHTFIQVDEKANPVARWNSGDIDMLIQNIK